ncbi:hypothetical protein [Thorsellia kenyensis]|uniref:Uncharacterized protein n=1 Tax=Thorsellia kenyensis TaxID=1549888 RepID=A0ABV6C6J2_9GAMM
MSTIIKVNLKPLTPSVPGRAKLLIKEWRFETKELRFNIQRNQDQFYLGEKGIWSPSIIYHEVSTLGVSAEGYYIDILDNILDPLLKLTGTSFKIELEDSEKNKAFGVLILEEGLLASSALGNATLNAESAPIPSKIQESTPPELDEKNIEQIELPQVDMTSELTAEEKISFDTMSAENQPKTLNEDKKKSSGVLKNTMIGLVSILILVAMACGILYYLKGPQFFKELFEKVQNQFDEIAPQSLLKTDETQISSAFNQENLNSACLITDETATDELAFVKSCLQSSPSGADLMKIIANAKSKKLCQVAQRIYAYKSQAGDKQISLAYAKEFDSAFNEKEGCFAEDKETAIYWYEKVLSVDPLHVEATERIKALQL